MLSTIVITTPATTNSEEICNLLIESIKMNCAADYENDPEIMNQWLNNKTPENISEWISCQNNLSFAAYDITNKKIVGFALMNLEGEILLNYVLSSHLHKGIGKYLLQAMEKSASTKGIKELSTVSTITAKSFYEGNGFIENGEPEYEGNILGDFPLMKTIN